MRCSGRVADCGCGELPSISVAVVVVWGFVFALFMIVFAMGVSAWLDARVVGLLGGVGVEAPIYAVSPPPGLITSLLWAFIVLSVVLIGLIIDYLRSVTILP